MVNKKARVAAANKSNSILSIYLILYNVIQTLANTPLQQPDELDVATTTLFDLVRRAQVCLIFYFNFCF